jgi:glutathione S-transferase
MLAERAWSSRTFSIADTPMVDELRLVDCFDGLAKCSACRDYVARVTARSTFVMARADHMAHFAAADIAGLCFRGLAL